MQRKSLTLFCLTAFLTFASLTVGCGGPNAAQVSGVVTLDDKPLANANVTFHPAGGEGAVAYGQTDAQGNYTLSTGTDKGLAPGDYVATVIATVEVPPTTPNGETTFKPTSPAKYADVEKSDLKHSVKSGSNTIPLALSSQ